LVTVKIIRGEQFVVAMFFEGDDNQRDEDIKEEERKDDEVDDVKDGGVLVLSWLRTSSLYRSIHRHSQQPVKVKKKRKVPGGTC